MIGPKYNAPSYNDAHLTEFVMTKYFASLVLFLAAWPSFAADLNGYTSQYECRAGGPNCNVDVAAYVTAACAQTITTADSLSTIESKLNSGPSPICLTSGNYISKGVVNITASGTAGARRVLRYTRAGDNGDKPWNQSTVDKARIFGLRLNRASYWIIHRVTVDGNGKDGSSTPMIEFVEDASPGDSDNNILDSVLAENAEFNLVTIGAGNDNNTIQNSVFRDCVPSKVSDPGGLSLYGAPKNIHVVNNEIYNCTHEPFVSEHSAPGAVFENNDLYITPSKYTDCLGNYNTAGPCTVTEDIFGIKSGGTAANPMRIIHNRIWGARKSDPSGVFSVAGTDGFLFIFANSTENPIGGAKYVEFRNNILWDGQLGVGDYWPNINNNSVVGNIIFQIKPYRSSTPSYAFSTNFMSNSEWYLNTVIDANSWFSFGGGNNNDIRCNVVINSGASGSTADKSTQVNYNAFYNTKPYTTENSGTNVIYPTSADAKHVDYCFWRKLQTGAESVCIPNARPTNASPHRSTCDPSIGTRLNIGVSDQPLF